MKDFNYFKRLNEKNLNEAEEDITDTETDTTDTETDVTADEDPAAEDKPAEDKPEEDEEASNEEEFIKMFDDQSFVDAFQNSIVQYVSEKLLQDEFNSFSVLPFIETEFKDDTFGVSIELETAATMNVNEEGKIVQKDIPEVDIVKYKIPVMDNLALMESESDKETISIFVMEALDSIKKVPR